MFALIGKSLTKIKMIYQFGHIDAFCNVLVLTSTSKPDFARVLKLFDRNKGKKRCLSKINLKYPEGF